MSLRVRSEAPRARVPLTFEYTQQKSHATRFCLRDVEGKYLRRVCVCARARGVRAWKVAGQTCTDLISAAEDARAGARVKRPSACVTALYMPPTSHLAQACVWVWVLVRVCVCVYVLAAVSPS